MSTTESQRPTKAPRPGPPQDLVRSSSHLLKRLAWLVKDRMFDAFEPTGLSPYHFAVLALLEEDPRETQATIADALGYDRSHLVGLLDELEERSLIERRRDPIDRRRHLVSLTADGKRALGRLRTVVARVENELLAALDDEQRETLHSLLLLLVAQHDERYAAYRAGASR